MDNFSNNANRTPLPKGHAVAVLLITPHGIPLIRDPKKPAPVYWKLPGGRGDARETPEQCAVRELKEELGISVAEKDLRTIHSEDKGNHIWTIFQAHLIKPSKMKSRGDEGEEIRIFHPRDILTQRDFFPNHRRVVRHILEFL